MMIGIDLVENKRIKKALKNPNFLPRILTEKEIEYVNSYKNEVEHIAGFFAAKEAVMKALENCKQISFKEIEILHKSSGKPYVVLCKKAKEKFLSFGYKNIEISISQTQHFATAICFMQ